MMSSALLSGLIALGLLPWTSGAETPKAVSLDFSKVKHRREVPRIARRGKDLSVTIDNARMLYLVDITVGTPPQPIRVQIDTGSSDLWVPHSKPGKIGGYSFNDSTTKQADRGNSTFATSYGSGEKVIGKFVHDVVEIGGISMGSVRFGWADDYNPTTSPYFTGLLDTWGIMGVGPPGLEAQAARGHQKSYPNIVAKLKADKLIHTQAFSLCLNSTDATSGTVLFGAVDSSKYSGPLISLPLVDNPVDKDFPFYAVQLSGIDAQSPSGVKTFASSNQSTLMYATLDSGATGIYLPLSIAQPIYDYLGATYIKEFASAVIPCNISTASTVFSFYFGGPNGVKINVPIANLIQPAMPLTNGAQYADNTTACVLQITPSINYMAILGDAFLRSAYVVYDNGNKQIAMAQANTSSTAKSNIQEIKAGMWGIPGVDTIMPTLPFDREAIAAEAPTAVELAPTGTATAGYNFTLPFNPARGSVTAVGPPGALFTGTGFVVPSDGMKIASSTSAAGGPLPTGLATTAASSSGKQPPKPTAAPTSGALKLGGTFAISGALTLGLGCLLFV